MFGLVLQTTRTVFHKVRLHCKSDGAFVCVQREQHFPTEKQDFVVTRYRDDKEIARETARTPRAREGGLSRRNPRIRLWEGLHGVLFTVLRGVCAPIPLSSSRLSPQPRTRIQRRFP